MQTQVNTHNIVSNSGQNPYFPHALRKQNLILSAIVMLSDKEIKLMNREDLLDALRMVQSTWPRSEERNIDKMDVTELRRVLAIVREHFRTQMNRQSTPQIWSPEFN
jgi:hypothetical protein